MMWISKIALGAFILIGLLSLSAQAEKYRRLVTFEWEQIEGAHGYDVEVTKKIKDKDKLYQLKTKQPQWEGRLTPGAYYIKIRAFDHRGVPGDWSEALPLLVNLDNVKVSSPEPNSQIKTSENDNVDVNMIWNPVQLADEYKLTIVSKEGEKILEETVKRTNFKAQLPVAKEYQLQISAMNQEGLQSDEIMAIPFTLLGPKLKKPAPEKPKTEFVRELKWTPVEHAEGYDYNIQKFDSKTRSWKSIQSGTSSETKIDFPSKWSGGTYALKVQAKGPFREPSENSEIKFKVRSGDRSPASEFNTMVRQSIDRVSRWYALFSYFVTQINYSSIYYDTAGATSYKSLGGTTRLGLGYDHEKLNWGFLSAIDYSGFQSEKGGILTYMAAEASAVYKKQLRERDEFRLQMGLFMRELPATLANGRTGEYSDSKVSGAGPHLGGEYWYAMSPQWGLQGNLHVYTNMLTLSTPNGAAINPSHSMQMGILGSYRYSQRMSFLFGFSRREDKIRYSQGTEKLCQTSACAGENKVEVEGNYLNLYAEYDF